MFALVLVAATFALILGPAFLLGSLRAGAPPWTSRFWAS